MFCVAIKRSSAGAPTLHGMWQCQGVVTGGTPVPPGLHSVSLTRSRAETRWRFLLPQAVDRRCYGIVAAEIALVLSNSYNFG